MSQQADSGGKHKTSDTLFEIRKMVNACIQCGTCTGSCPNAFGMDFTPRYLWRLVLTEQKEEIFKSRTFGLCSACYYCTLRCPRGLPLTEAMSALKQIAARENPDFYRRSVLFYKNFMDSVRRYGRVREAEFMTLYFVELKNPLVPFQFAHLGIKLMLKKKISVRFPSRGNHQLESIFRKVKEMEPTS
jgi:heterodisulfide reductase subunit C